MNKERLLVLADIMERTEPSKYDQNSWISGIKYEDIEAFDGRSRRVTLKENPCGSTACVLGNAALAPEFKDSGIGLKLFHDSDSYGMRDLMGSSSREAPSMTAVVKLPERSFVNSKYLEADTGDKFRYLEGIEAGAYLFDITYAQAYVFFAENFQRKVRMFYRETGEVLIGDEIQPKNVAIAIRKFVATDGASMEPYLKAV